MRRFLLVLLFAAIGGGAFWSWKNSTLAKEKVLEILHGSTFQTLEVRYSADAIMQLHKKELLKDESHTFLAPSLQFLPYLLLDVKYSQSQNKTSEGVILWGLVDGEMVLNTQTWEKTHGFTDCIASNTTRQEFQVLNALSSQGGAWDRQGLSQFLHVENHILDQWIKSCQKKSLVVQSGNSYRLHLENPKLRVIPETRLDHFLVTKPTKYAHRIKKRYRPTQIETIAKAAFGLEFAIRKTTEVFLPVYSIVVQNPDGSRRTTYWNALNGKQFHPLYDLE